MEPGINDGSLRSVPTAQRSDLSACPAAALFLANLHPELVIVHVIFITITHDRYRQPGVNECDG
jgi:hypothetical protein